MAGTKMHVFLDLWGVLLDSVKMNEEYNKCAAGMLTSLLGGEESKWLEAYSSAWETYLLELAEAEGKAGDWLAMVDRLDSSLVLDTLKAIGTEWRPPNILTFARDFENKVASSVAVAYPEVKDIMESLRKAGHKVYIATQAGEWNACGALSGSGLSDLVDGIFSGSSQRAFKNTLVYWRDIPKSVQATSRELLLVDDRMDYLKAASSAGFKAILLNRSDRTRQEKAPKHVLAVVSSLADLPSLVESLPQRSGWRKPRE